MSIERTPEDIARFTENMLTIAKSRAGRAAIIAEAIRANCERYAEQSISRDVWSTEQNYLWGQAAQDWLAADVMQIVCPSLTEDQGEAMTILCRVCAWCTPRTELDALNRRFPMQVSHSMCPACQAKMLADSDAHEDAKLKLEMDAIDSIKGARK